MPLVISHSFTEPAVSFQTGMTSNKPQKKMKKVFDRLVLIVINKGKSTVHTLVKTCLLLFKISCCTIAGVPGMVKVGSL
jgi:hypothetical protein